MPRRKQKSGPKPKTSSLAKRIELLENQVALLRLDLQARIPEKVAVEKKCTCKLPEFGQRMITVYMSEPTCPIHGWLRIPHAG